MSNSFLKVDKDYFKLGLNPIEILLLSQVVEFNTNTGDCFMSDKALAAQFGSSEKTISRGLASLEEKGFITRETKNIKGGRVRHIKPVENAINAALTTDKMTVDSNQQTSNCPLTTDKLTVDNGQNDFIKENIKEKEKENKEASHAFGAQIFLEPSGMSPEEIFKSMY
jgi:predicted transcriptional regulator